jgi:hypothetical protein
MASLDWRLIDRMLHSLTMFCGFMLGGFCRRLSRSWSKGQVKFFVTRTSAPFSSLLTFSVPISDRVLITDSQKIQKPSIMTAFHFEFQIHQFIFVTNSEVICLPLRNFLQHQPRTASALSLCTSRRHLIPTTTPKRLGQVLQELLNIDVFATRSEVRTSFSDITNKQI